MYSRGRLRLKCDGARTETRFRLSAKRTSPFKSAGVSVQSTTGSRGVRISGSNAGYTIIIVFFTNFMHKLFILIHLLHSSTCFEHYYAHRQEVKLY